jgi:hypothetical protein
MIVGDSGYQTSWRLRAILAWASSFHAGGAFGHKSFQSAICVGPGQPGGPSKSVPGTRTVGEEDLVHEAFGGGEAELGEI